MRTSLVLLLTLAAAGCKKPGVPAKPDMAANVQAAAPAAGETVRGKVLERIDASSYSYLRLDTGSGETWAAVPKVEVALGAEVGVANAMPMLNFESKTLNRKFDRILFGTLAGQGEGAPPAAAPATPPHAGMAASGMAADHAAAARGPVELGEIKVSKAQGANGRTVAEVFAQKAALKEKKVAIRGKVVKFSPGILGRNWVHLRDGSGATDKGDNDLTFTTQDAVTVGDVVLAQGTVRLEKDFGAGYAYPVIVEEASVAKAP